MIRIKLRNRFFRCYSSKAELKNEAKSLKVTDPPKDKDALVKLHLLPLEEMHPWHLSVSSPRIPAPTLWQKMKTSVYTKSNYERISTLLHSPAYAFPKDFQRDAEIQLRGLFKLLENDENVNEDSLRQFMLKKLASPWAVAHERIRVHKGKVVFKTSQEYNFDNAPLSLTILKSHCTFGPYPAPRDHVAVDWGPVTLVVPEKEAEFKNYVHQKSVEKKAESEGVYIEVDIRVDMPLVYQIVDTDNDKVLLNDSKSFFHCKFTSPHFNQWDEIFEPHQENEWKLRWLWKIADIDQLVESHFPKTSQEPKIDWSAHRKITPPKSKELLKALKEPQKDKL